jgi:hypothetical protein
MRYVITAYLPTTDDRVPETRTHTADNFIDAYALRERLEGSGNVTRVTIAVILYDTSDANDR